MVSHWELVVHTDPPPVIEQQTGGSRAYAADTKNKSAIRYFIVNVNTETIDVLLLFKV